MLAVKVDVNGNAFRGTCVKVLKNTEIYRDEEGYMRLVKISRDNDLKGYLGKVISDFGGSRKEFVKVTGISESFLSQVMNQGLRAPKADTNLIKLAKYKGITLEELKERCNLN